MKSKRSSLKGWLKAVVKDKENNKNDRRKIRPVFIKECKEFIEWVKETRRFDLKS